MLKAQRFQANAASTIAFWPYTTTGYDSNTYQGMMVGRSPFAHGHRVTTIPTFVIPVKLTFADSGDVFDPSAADSCIANKTVDGLIANSPIFQSSDFVMNGVDVGSTQYLDAFQRANFWKQVQGTPYHTVFSTAPTVLAAVSVTVPVGKGVTQAGFTCGHWGEMDIDWFDAMVQSTILPNLAAQGVGLTNFPQLVFDSVFMYLNQDTSQCCALGYHSGFFSGGNLQTYSVNGFDTSGTFGGDTDTLSHEVAEWMDDPNGSNPVPVWGNEGQVVGGCQNNLEVGDPLSEGFGTPTNPFSVTLNGFDYHLQELAFFSWFYGQSPSFGAGGDYSDNGSFTGFAIACPPGGTH